MGGDAFQNAQRLTNQQFETITKQITNQLQQYCFKIQPYIPLPQKQSHGDIDFLIILHPPFSPLHILKKLNITQFKQQINNNTFNTLYKNKQVDFKFCSTNKQFQLILFYKSYGCIGAYLGTFLPSKQVKMTAEGMVATGNYGNIKMEFLVSQEVRKMLQFFGLDFQRYQKGFQTRKQLFQYFRTSKFLDENKWAHTQHKDQAKLLKYFAQYLKSQGKLNMQKKCTFSSQQQEQLFKKSPLQFTLRYFKKYQQFQKELNNLIQKKNRIILLNKKFSSLKLLENFNVTPLQLEDIKRQFLKKRFMLEQQNQQKAKQNYYDFVEQSTVDQILNQYEKVCKLQRKSLEIKLEKQDMTRQEIYDVKINKKEKKKITNQGGREKEKEQRRQRRYNNNKKKIDKQQKNQQEKKEKIQQQQQKYQEKKEVSIQ